MALVSGQSFFPSAAAAELDSSPNSDDDYDYVSSLAEQIAHAMLDDDEPSEEESHGFLIDPQALLSERTAALIRLQRDAEIAKERALSARRSMSRIAPSHQFSIEDIAFNDARNLLPFQETWEYYNSRARHNSFLRSHHSSSTVPTPLHDRNMNAFYARQSMQHAPWGGSPCIVEERSSESWNRSNLEVPLSQQGHRAIPRKESVGTGVFLPRVANFSSQARRKQGDSSSKFSDKNKCRGGGS